LWALIEPLLPPWPEKSPGLRPVPDRLCLQGILYVLYNDIAWQLLPLELGFGSGQIRWRRLDRWQQSGVFDQLHRILLAELNAAGELDWSRACVDGSHIRAKRGRRHRSVAGRPPQDGQAVRGLDGVVRAERGPSLVFRPGPGESEQLTEGNVRLAAVDSGFTDTSGRGSHLPG
jgi:transposase